MPILGLKLGSLAYWLKKEWFLFFLFLMAITAVGIHQIQRKPHFFNNCSQTSVHYRKVPKKPWIQVQFFMDWRKNFLAQSKYLDDKGLVRGIFLGEDAWIPSPVASLFKKAGLYHLLAASGFNCWIVSFLIGAIAQLVFFFFYPLLPSSAGLFLKRWTLPLSHLSGAWMFWLWSDQSPPITRAAFFISLKFLLDFYGLHTAFGRIILIQYLCSLIVLPKLWQNASFQLTFGCLFGILFVPKLLKPLQQRIASSLPTYPQGWKQIGFHYLWQYCTVSFGACLGALPTTWIIFGEIQFMSVLTNWLAIPFVSFGIMPIALLQMILLAPIPSLLKWSLSLAEQLGWLAAQLADGLLASLYNYLRLIS